MAKLHTHVLQLNFLNKFVERIVDGFQGRLAVVLRLRILYEVE